MFVAGREDGAGIRDFLERCARVFLVGGTASCSTAFVFDRLFWDGVVGNTIGAESVLRRRLVGVLVATGRCAVVGTNVVAGKGVAGATLGIGMSMACLSFVMDLVMRAVVGVSSVATLGAGCTLGIAGNYNVSCLSSVQVGRICVMRCISRRS